MRLKATGLILDLFRFAFDKSSPEINLYLIFLFHILNLLYSLLVLALSPERVPLQMKINTTL